MFQQAGEGLGTTLLRGLLSGIGGVDPNELLLKREQAEIGKLEAEARIAAVEAQTAESTADLAVQRGEQISAFNTLMGLGGEFVSPAGPANRPPTPGHRHSLNHRRIKSAVSHQRGPGHSSSH